MNIKVSTGFSKERVENFYKFHMTRIDKMRYLFYVGVGMLLLVSIISLIVFTSNPNAIVVTIVSILANIILITTRPFRLSSAFKKAIKNTPISDKTYHIKVNDQGVNYIMDTEDSFYSWNDIVRLIEIDDAYYIYVSDNKAIILPKYPVEVDDRRLMVELVSGLGKYKKYKY